MNMEIIKPDRKWNDSVRSIIAMGKFLLNLREKYSRDEIMQMALVDYGINESTVDKVGHVSRHPILSDPSNSDKLPAYWALLYEMKFLPHDVLQKLIDEGKAKSISKYEIWALRGPKVPQKSKNVGNKINLDHGESLIQFVKGGMLREAEFNNDIDQTAKILQIGAGVYRKIRSIILLSQREELTESDRKFVHGILAKIEKTRNVRSHYLEVKPLIDKMWGNSRNKKFTDKNTQKRTDAYKDSVFILGDSCRRVHDLPQPYMSEPDTNECINELTEASRLIRQLAEKLRRSKDD